MSFNTVCLEFVIGQQHLFLNAGLGSVSSVSYQASKTTPIPHAPHSFRGPESKFTLTCSFSGETNL